MKMQVLTETVLDDDPDFGHLSISSSSSSSFFNSKNVRFSIPFYIEKPFILSLGTNSRNELCNKFFRQSSLCMLCETIGSISKLPKVDSCLGTFVELLDFVMNRDVSEQSLVRDVFPVVNENCPFNPFRMHPVFSEKRDMEKMTKKKKNKNHRSQFPINVVKRRRKENDNEREPGELDDSSADDFSEINFDESDAASDSIGLGSEVDENDEGLFGEENENVSPFDLTHFAEFNLCSHHRRTKYRILCCILKILKMTMAKDDDEGWLSKNVFLSREESFVWKFLELHLTTDLVSRPSLEQSEFGSLTSFFQTVSRFSSLSNAVKMWADFSSFSSIVKGLRNVSFFLVPRGSKIGRTRKGQFHRLVWDVLFHRFTKLMTPTSSSLPWDSAKTSETFFRNVHRTSDTQFFIYDAFLTILMHFQTNSCVNDAASFVNVLKCLFSSENDLSMLPFYFTHCIIWWTTAFIAAERKKKENGFLLRCFVPLLKVLTRIIFESHSDAVLTIFLKCIEHNRFDLADVLIDMHPRGSPLSWVTKISENWQSHFDGLDDSRMNFSRNEEVLFFMLESLDQFHFSLLPIFDRKKHTRFPLHSSEILLNSAVKTGTLFPVCWVMRHFFFPFDFPSPCFRWKSSFLCLFHERQRIRRQRQRKTQLAQLFNRDQEQRFSRETFAIETNHIWNSGCPPRPHREPVVNNEDISRFSDDWEDDEEREEEDDAEDEDDDDDYHVDDDEIDFPGEEDENDPVSDVTLDFFFDTYFKFSSDTNPDSFWRTGPIRFPEENLFRRNYDDEEEEEEEGGRGGSTDWHFTTGPDVGILEQGEGTRSGDQSQHPQQTDNDFEKRDRFNDSQPCLEKTCFSNPFFRFVFLLSFRSYLVRGMYFQSDCRLQEPKRWPFEISNFLENLNNAIHSFSLWFCDDNDDILPRSSSEKDDRIIPPFSLRETCFTNFVLKGSLPEPGGCFFPIECFEFRKLVISFIFDCICKNNLVFLHILFHDIRLPVVDFRRGFDKPFRFLRVLRRIIGKQDFFFMSSFFFVNIFDSDKKPLWKNFNFDFDSSGFSVNQQGNQTNKFSRMDKDQSSHRMKNKFRKDDSCPICLEDFIDVKCSIIQTNCGHCFCLSCFQKFLLLNYRTQRCCFCRSRLIDKTLISLDATPALPVLSPNQTTIGSPTETEHQSSSQMIMYFDD